MRTSAQYFIIPAILAVIAGCGSGAGPDAISSHPRYEGGEMPACAICHTGSLDPAATNGEGAAGKHVMHVTSRGIGCEVCHLNYSGASTHMNGQMDTANPSVNLIAFNAINPNGQWLNDTGAQTGSCGSLNCHGTDTLDWYGAGGWAMPSCTTCHASGSVIDPVITNGEGTAGKHVMHVSSREIGCEKCHLNYPESGTTHMNGQFDTSNPDVHLVAFDATNPDGQWLNDTGAQTGSCGSLNCHGTDTLDWYGAESWTMPPSCSDCHSTALGTRRRVFGASGDFASNATITSGHVATGTDPTPAQCVVCHSMASHTSGTVKLLDADTGTVISYNTASPSSLEPFCLSCHDTNGANGNLSPFSDGRTLGSGLNIAGNKIKDYWNSAYNTHKTSGLTCAGSGALNTGCHGRSGAINMHGSTVNGLLTNNMNFHIPLTFDTNSALPVAHYDYNNYKLCFDCHDSLPGSTVSSTVILGYKAGGKYDIEKAPSPNKTTSMTIQSLFRERFIVSPPDSYPNYWSGANQSYNDTMTPTDDRRLPLHNYHLIGAEDLFGGGLTADYFSWKYRGDAGQVGRITCTACHNAHGTSNPVRGTYSEIGMSGISAYTNTFIYLGVTYIDAYKSFDPAFDGFGNSLIQYYPTNCAYDCHGFAGARNYWHTPAEE